MGIGDKPKQYSPAYAPILCDVSGLKFAPCLMRECKEPRVLRKYGKGGTVHVSIYICRKCKYHTTTPFCGAIGCGYKENNKEVINHGNR